MEIDFVALAEGVKKNNLGLGGIILQALVRIEGETAMLEKSGQKIRLRESAGGEGASGPAWLSLGVSGWEKADTVAVEVLGGAAPRPIEGQVEG